MDANAIGVRATIAVLRRRIRLIVITATSIVLAAALILFSLTPIYSATTLVQVDPAQNNILGAEYASTADDSTRVDNVVEVLRSDGLLLAVVATGQLTADPAFTAPGMLDRFSALWTTRGETPAPDAELAGRALSTLRTATTIHRRGLTHLIAIQARSANPERAAMLATLIAQTYIDRQIEAKTADIRAARADIETRLATASAALNAGDASLAGMDDSRLDQIVRTSPREFKFEPELGPAEVAPEPLRRRDAQMVHDAARRQYQQLLDRYWELTAQENLQVADATIISAALTPISPAYPNKTASLLLAALAAIGVSVALAFLYENYLGGFTSRAQLRLLLPTRFATTVPRSKSGPNLANLVVTSPLSGFTEAIRRLRLLTDHASQNRATEPSDDAPGRIIMICSACPGDGKTTLALALARSYALVGSRTLLVDADLRKPGLFRQLGSAPAPGLLEFLSNGNDNQTGPYVSKDPASGAMVIVGALPSTVPTDQLLAGPVFTHLLQAARSTFDIVIVDTPPISAAIDALAVAPQADAIVFVARWASTSQSDAHEAFSSIAALKAPNAEIVTVLNQQYPGRAHSAREYGDDYAAAV